MVCFVASWFAALGAGHSEPADVDKTSFFTGLLTTCKTSVSLSGHASSFVATGVLAVSWVMPKSDAGSLDPNKIVPSIAPEFCDNPD